MMSDASITVIYHAMSLTVMYLAFKNNFILNEFVSVKNIILNNDVIF